ncbi:amidohydrolase family protein [Steroidobacter sp. S1-65]|uniref:Amidohydrolase family protein n=1 Tax=Steroidobacter gossypii TaxID=2805490 RepID=A0ABS1WRW5_9GAMM|nr:amidohydrolase family protein [Steroidobacter gossypii]MBM0103717.1 amidohydrolase family protein [Steroidobacter gossypii]
MPQSTSLRRFESILCAALLFGASFTCAAEALWVRAGKLIDVERGRVLDDQAIHIEGERVVAVTDYQSESAAAGRWIDWSGYTVLPGLMDMHTHLIGNITSSEVAAPLYTSGAEDVLLGIANARRTLRAGFTTVRDVGCYRAFTDVALRNAIDGGIVDGPRMFVAGAYITVTGGGGEVTGFAPDVVVPAEMRRGVANSETEVRQRVRELISGGATFIKVIATGAVLTAGTTPGAAEYSEAEIRAAVDEAAQYGIFVTAHAHGAEGIKRAARAGVRSIEHASYLDDEGIALMKKHGTWLVADIYNGDYIAETGRRDHWSEEIMRKNDETTQRQRDGFAKAVKAGVRIAFGTDAGVYPHGDNARQFAYMVRYGLTPMEAIRSATLSSARLLGKERELGSITPGKFADIIAVEGDPLIDIEKLHQVRGVIKAGRPIGLH